MPLSALIDGERKTSVFMTDEEWLMLKARKPNVVLECCETRGFMRVSKLGTRHFGHINRPADCTAGPESAQHLLLKERVAAAVKRSGWDAEIEASDAERSWRADVLANKESVRVAFEIQLSPITLEQLQDRQAAYANGGIYGCWFARGYAARTLFRHPRRDMPVFWFGDDDLIDPDETPSRIHVNQNLSMSIESAVVSLLREDIKWCDQMIQRTLEGLLLYRIYCPLCHGDLVIYFLAEAQSSCHHFPDLACAKLKLWGNHWESLGEPGIIDGVKRYVQGNPEICQTIRYPSWQSGRFGFSCANCGELIGKGASSWTSWKVPLARIETATSFQFVPEAHWCHSVDHDFCC
jgi:hypothetical protein